MASRGVDKTEGIKQVDDTLLYFNQQLASMRGGRVVPGLIRDLSVEVYSSHMPLSQLGNISVIDHTTLSVKLWDESVVKNVEKTLRLDERGFALRIDGLNIYVKSPPLSEERRKEYVKYIKEVVEEIRQSIRGHRNKMMDYIKWLKEDSQISENEEKKMKKEVEDIIKEAMSSVEKESKEKEVELLSF